MWTPHPHAGLGPRYHMMVPPFPYEYILCFLLRSLFLAVVSQRVLVYYILFRIHGVAQPVSEAYSQY